MAGLENILMGVSHLHPIFFSKFLGVAICLILRSCGSEANGWAGEYTDGRIISSPNFFSEFFGKCNLLDFAELRMRSCGVGGVERNAARYSAWQALHLSLTFSSGHIATHHAAFSAMHLQGAIDFAELRKRGWRRGANGGAECRKYFFFCKERFYSFTISL